MEVTRETSYKKMMDHKNMIKDVRNLSLEQLFSDFYSYQHDGELPDASLNSLISFAAEQTRNYSEDESEKERKEAIAKLIEFAGKKE